MESLSNGSLEYNMVSPVACYILLSTSCSSGSIGSPVNEILKKHTALQAHFYKYLLHGCKWWICLAIIVVLFPELFYNVLKKRKSDFKTTSFGDIKRNICLRLSFAVGRHIWHHCCCNYLWVIVSKQTRVAVHNRAGVCQCS